MRSIFRKVSLLGVLALIASLMVVGVAGAQENGEEPNGDDLDTGFFYHFDGDTLYWSIYEFSSQEEFEEACVTDEVAPENEDKCASVTDEFDEHGDVVSAFATTIEHGPGSGCLVAQIAQGDYGLKTDDEPDVDQEDDGRPEGVNTGCPDWLYPWLNGLSDEGPPGAPDFVQGLIRGNGDDNDDSAGPPNGVRTGPPPGVPAGGNDRP